MKILAVIVLYKESLYSSRTYLSLLRSNPDLSIFIYDNSPTPMHNQSEFSSYIYVHDPLNRGVSYAYNRGAEYAQINNFDWILLLDQDTKFPDQLISSYREFINRYPTINLFSLVLALQDGSYFSPILEKKTRLNGLFIEPGVYKLKDFRLVNSGLLVNVGAFWKSGGYNEAAYLDFSDFQFIKRFRKNYNSFCIVPGVAIQDFSSKQLDLNKSQFRFSIFCECAKACETDSLLERLNIHYTVFRRMCGLLLQFKKLTFLNIFIKKYL